jgi:hypothetical protein
MGFIERIQVSPEDRERLEKLVRDRNTPQKIVWRARIALLAGDGTKAGVIARTVGKSVLSVRRWRRRYAAKGVDGVPPVRPGASRCRQGRSSKWSS